MNRLPTVLRCAARLLGLLILATAAPLRAQQASPIQTGITLERDTVTVGQVVKLLVRVHAPRGAIISFPSAVDSVGPVQALEAPVVTDGADSANAADRIATYRLSAWDIGQQPIKLGDVLVQTGAGDRRITLDLPSLFVSSVLPKDSAQRVPKPPRPLLDVATAMPWWYWLLAVLAGLLLLYLLWRLVERLRRRPEHTGDPWADARNAFERVEKLRLVEAGEPGRHAALMTDVVRRYLSERIAGVSLALTTSELLDVVHGAPTVPAQRLRALLHAVDPVKFARAPIAAEAAKSIGEDAKTVVTEEHERSIAAAAAAANAPAPATERAA